MPNSVSSICKMQVYLLNWSLDRLPLKALSNMFHTIIDIKKYILIIKGRHQKLVYPCTIFFSYMYNCYRFYKRSLQETFVVICHYLEHGFNSNVCRIIHSYINVCLYMKVHMYICIYIFPVKYILTFLKFKDQYTVCDQITIQYICTLYMGKYIFFLVLFGQT